MNRVARTQEEVLDLASASLDLGELDARSTVCRACPRLVEWREHVAATKRAAFADQDYWGRPVSGFGPVDAPIGILGLAPAAHGGNRTGRIFTGDRSGDVLFASLHRVGLANQAESVHADDGLRLFHTRMFPAVRCAPPANKPTPEERAACSGWLARELELLRPHLKVIVVLGAFGWNAFWPVSGTVGVTPPRPRPRFGHGAEFRPESGPVLLGCYHVSQQNTFTGKLTPEMLDTVLRRAKELAEPR
ncbi:MAG: uracil-DNA glycosylase [Micromonosporaceae bacterium]|nr:uracil-DNA glycosylase [Micromonosporaceae bacterium]